MDCDRVSKKEMSGTDSQGGLKPHRDAMLRNPGVEAFTKVTNNETEEVHRESKKNKGLKGWTTITDQRSPECVLRLLN